MRQLTDEERNQIEIWEVSKNPADRLFTNYYTFCRWQIFDDYLQEAATTDLEAKQAAWDVMDSTLNKLREDYIKDLQLLIELQQAATGPYTPARVRLKLEDESWNIL